jgi:NADPH:quinone reductase-like Zn-dependent oxidoreductase
MLAATIDQFVQSFDEVKVKQVAIPTLRPGHAIISVKAASINPVDKLLVLGYMAGLGWKTPFPYIPGEDFAGVVHSVAEDVTNVAVGDEVFATNWGQGQCNDEIVDPIVSGAFAEYILIPTAKLSKKPVGLSFADAAAIGIAATTAHECLFKIGGVVAGSRVLILGASSAVGQYAIQFAKIAGAIVYTTCSGRTKGFVEANLNADQVIDYGVTPWESADGPKNVDVIFDCVGEAEALKRAQANGTVKADGKFVTIANFSVGYDPTAYPPLTYAAAMCFTQNPASQDQIAQWIVEGKVKVFVDGVFPFTQEGVIEIFNKIGGGKSVGKNILQISA